MKRREQGVVDYSEPFLHYMKLVKPCLHNSHSAEAASLCQGQQHEGLQSGSGHQRWIGNQRILKCTFLVLLTAFLCVVPYLCCHWTQPLWVQVSCPTPFCIANLSVNNRYWLQVNNSLTSKSEYLLWPTNTAFYVECSVWSAVPGVGSHAGSAC